MRVPTLGGQQVQANNLPGVQIENAQTPQAMRSLSSAGALSDLGQLASGATALYQQQMQEQNETRVRDALNKRVMLEQHTEQNDLDGFRNKRGAEAVGFDDGEGNNFIKYYDKVIRTGTSEIEQGLSNNTQRKLFQQKVAERDVNFQSRLQGYYLQQNDTYRTEVAKTSLDVTANELASNYKDPFTTEKSIESIASAMQDLGRVQGWDQSTVRNETMKVGSKALRGAVEKMQADGAIMDIPAFYQRFGQYMTPQDQDHVTGTMQSNTAQTIQGAILTAKESNDMASLDKLGTTLADDKIVSAIGLNRVNTLRGQVIAAKNSMVNRIEIEANKREQVAKTASTNLLSNIMTSELITEEQFQQVVAQTQGTQFENVAQNYIKNYADIQKFKALPIAQQEAQLPVMEAEFSKRATGNPKLMQDLLGVYRNVLQENRKNANSNPVAYIAKQGLYKPQPIDAASIVTPEGSQQVAAIVADRVQTLNAAREKDPSIGVMPLQDAELQGVKQVITGMNNQQKLQFFGNMIGSLKEVSKGKEAYIGFMKQVAGDDVLLRAASIAEYQGFKSNKGTKVSAAILQGQQILKDKTTVLPSDDVMAKKYNDYVGDLYTGQERAEQFEVFKAIHASLAKTRGISYEKRTDSPDDDLIKLAQDLATGGVYSQDIKYRTSPNAEKIEGWKVLKPYGMQDEPFELRMNAGIAMVAKKYNTTPDQLEDYRLIQSPSNDRQYFFLGENNQPLVLNGVRVTLDLGK